MASQFKRTYLKKLRTAFIILTFSCSFKLLFSQNIPIMTNTIQVNPVSYTNVVNTLHTLGYKIATEDKQKQIVKTDFKVCPGTICHISISVIFKGSDAVISGHWWTDTAPPEGPNSENIAVIYHVDSQMDLLFEELLKYAKALGGSRISYSTTGKNK
jgi:hypothetical protein